MATPENPFVRPASGELFSPQKHPEWANKLFIVRPNYVEHVTFDQTQGPKKVVNAYVVIIDLINPQNGMPTVLDGAQIGGAGLVPQIENKIGQLVLGRLTQGAPQGAKSGMFKLDSNYTDADAALAGQYVQAFPLPPVPEAPAPAPAPAPPVGSQGQTAWGQPPVPGAGAPPQWQGQAPASQPAAALAQQWGQAAPAAAQQDPQLVQRVQAMGIQVTPDMDNNVLNMIANSPRQ